MESTSRKTIFVRGIIKWTQIRFLVVSSVWGKLSFVACNSHFFSLRLLLLHWQVYRFSLLPNGSNAILGDGKWLKG